MSYSIQPIRKYTLAFLQNFLRFKEFYNSRKSLNESDNLKREYVHCLKGGNDPSSSSRIQLYLVFSLIESSISCNRTLDE